MPSGAKKRKAAKKKLRKEAHNNNGGAHPQANDDTKSHDERESDGGEVEKEPSEEGAGDNHDGGEKEISLGEQNTAEIDAGKVEEKLNDVTVEEAEDVAEESRNRDASAKHKSSSSSSSSSSGSDDEEVAVEKEKPVVLELGKEEPQVEGSLPEVPFSEEMVNPTESMPEEVSAETSAPSEAVCITKVESVPIEESVKQVISLSPESHLVTESVLVEDATASETVESAVKHNVEEVLPPSDEKDKISASVMDLVEEKVETKVIQVVDSCSENLPLPERVHVATRENEALLPPSSGVTIAERNGKGDHVKDTEKQPLVSSVPVPVRQTSWMGCCGLFEVFSGGSGR